MNKTTATIFTPLFWAGMLLPPFVFWQLGLVLPVVDVNGLSSESLPMLEQMLVFTTAFIVKPLYMTLALVVALMLRKHDGVEFTAIRRGMILFYLGEAACAANYLCFNDRSLLMEYWHDYGMLSCFSLMIYALLVWLDDRIINYGNPVKRCVLLPLCRGCYKQQAMGCNLWALFLYLIPALLVMAALPLTAVIKGRTFFGSILGKTVLIDHPALSQFMEARLFPIWAMLFLLFSFGVLLRQKESGFALAKIPFAIGSGLLGFSLMRFLCYWGFAAQVPWANIWEETMEMLFIGFMLLLALKVRSAAPPVMIEPLQFTKTEA